MPITNYTTGGIGNYRIINIPPPQPYIPSNAELERIVNDYFRNHTSWFASEYEMDWTLKPKNKFKRIN